jgi:hypothetical protein
LQALFVKTFRRKEITVDHIKALCTRRGWQTGRDGRFEQGLTPHNKGKPCPPGKGGKHPNARKTQFQKGRQPHNTKFAGHERRDKKDGYVYLSVNETNPHTGFERRHVLKHKYLWEQKNGPVPKGYALKAIDSNRANTDPDNWELVPRSMLPRLAGGRYGTSYDDAPKELKPAIFTIAKIKDKLREVRK